MYVINLPIYKVNRTAINAMIFKLDIQYKNKTYHSIRRVPIPKRKMAETDARSIPFNIHAWPLVILAWYMDFNKQKTGGVKLIL